METPQPPSELFTTKLCHSFLPHIEFVDWMREMFIDDDAELCNPEHSHLQFAEYGVLFTNMDNISKSRRIIGMSEMFTARGNKWVKGRQEQQIYEWFGFLPDFILTFDANFWVGAGDAERFALVEHELYHCGQAMDEFGAPRFNQTTGKPVFCMKGHDVEEFVGVVRRYGAEAAGVKDLIDAANKPPLIDKAKIDGICGTCTKKVA